MRATTELLPPRRNGAFALERRPGLLTRPSRRVPTEGGGPDAGRIQRHTPKLTHYSNSHC